MKEIDTVENHPRVFRFTDLGNKKKLFEKMAEVLSSKSNSSFNRVLDGLLNREKLGSTYIGKGVAIPHCKLSVDDPRAAIIVLDNAVKYSDDNAQQVDIIFGLVVPDNNSEQHLHLLSSIARCCDDDSWLNGLRSQNTELAIRKYIMDTESNLGEIL